ncbi:HIT family protein [Thiomicrorhabdus xiamenensis]|uniref:HIT family protein n=1 Tax=Thiomicrorhabdus xiamenensis TaxID=2739063 RepID=A0A7D4SYY8_9GAMM|nr:HIT family protein [Thiomicrorhabdus xiamenensis]QKI88262.1 HIT family protein [Thiomicrorhabdus xiamenensis]
METCPFCQIDGYLQNASCYARFDIYPVTEGHTLIIPKRHAETWFDMTRSEQIDALELVEQAKTYLLERYQPDGFNIGVNCGEVAGQSVPHAHIHLIPRYSGDTDDPKGGVRGVIPEKQKY